jgi:hypothetical protein
MSGISKIWILINILYIYLDSCEISNWID